MVNAIKQFINESAKKLINNFCVANLQFVNYDALVLALENILKENLVNDDYTPNEDIKNLDIDDEDDLYDFTSSINIYPILLLWRDEYLKNFDTACVYNDYDLDVDQGLEEVISDFYQEFVSSE